MRTHKSTHITNSTQWTIWHCLLPCMTHACTQYLQHTITHVHIISMCVLYAQYILRQTCPYIQRTHTHSPIYVHTYIHPTPTHPNQHLHTPYAHKLSIKAIAAVRLLPLSPQDVAIAANPLNYTKGKAWHIMPIPTPARLKHDTLGARAEPPDTSTTLHRRPRHIQNPYT